MKANSYSPVREQNRISPRSIALCLLAFVVALMVLGLTGCKDSTRVPSGDNSSGAAQIAGEYTLVSVDGKAVPCVVSHEGMDVTMKSGVFTINADGTCRSVSTFSVGSNPDVHRIVDATYDRSGMDMTMRWKGAGTTKGTVNGDTFTMNNEGMIFTYRK